MHFASVRPTLAGYVASCSTCGELGTFGSEHEADASCTAHEDTTDRQRVRERIEFQTRGLVARVSTDRELLERNLRRAVPSLAEPASYQHTREL